MSKFEKNDWNTTDLVLDVMRTCARRTNQDINDDNVSDTLYWICCDLESWPEDHGFGSSDHYSYIEQAKKQIVTI